MTRPHDSWLRPLTSPPMPDLTVICLPHAGGASSYFRRWIPVAPTRVELLGVQYPGREDRISEPVPGTVASLADEVAAAIGSELRERSRPRWALFGHSLGAAIAFEVTRRLENQDLQPDRLIVSARHAPHISKAGTLHLASDDQLVADMRRLGGTASPVLDDPEIRSLLLPTIRADYQLAETYQPSTLEPGRITTETPYTPMIATPITAIVGDRDTEASPDDGRQWAAVTHGPFEIRVLRGGHFYLAEDPRTAVIEVTGAIAPELTNWPSTP